MSEAVAKPRWYHVTPDRLMIGLLAAVLLVLLADRFELAGLTRSSGWNVLLAAAVVCLGLLGGLLWFVVSLLLRRRFQFGLKSVFVLTLLVAVLCSWFAVKNQQAKRQKEAALAIQQLGGKVICDYEVGRNSPVQKLLPERTASCIVGWCRNLVGADFLWDVLAVTFTFARIGDADLAYLKELRKLEYLGLSYTRVTDAGLVHLKELSNIFWLELDGTLNPGASARSADTCRGRDAARNKNGITLARQD